MSQQKAPKQDNSGFGLKTPAPKDDDWRAKEQDGENRLLSEQDFNDRNRMAGNE